MRTEFNRNVDDLIRAMSRKRPSCSGAARSGYLHA